jgi:hypothetical protein
MITREPFSLIRRTMDTSRFLLVIMTGTAVIAISYALDQIWAATMPVQTIYYLVRAPGVVLHECAHIIGCLLTGARIVNIVFFSKEGGSVTYTRPIVPYIGDVIISMAPLFAIPLMLFVLTGIFGSYLGCIFPVFPSTVNSPGSLLLVWESIATSFSANLVTRFNGWFLLYMYLTISLVLSVAPSKEDMKNAAVGFLLICLAGIMILWSGIAVAENLLAEMIHLLGIGFTLGLVYGCIALAISLPLIFWYAYTHRS